MTPAGELMLGVTGHRFLNDPKSVREKMAAALDHIEAVFPSQPLHLLTPLAEGADRLAAELVLQREGGRISAILPVPAQSYLQDFVSETSQVEFRQLLDSAAKVISLDSKDGSEQRYLKAGEYMLDRCQILLAVWDGLPSRGVGGTADIVALARNKAMPLVLISVGSPADRASTVVYERFPPATYQSTRT